MKGLFAGTPFERPVTCDGCGNVVEQCVCPPVPVGGPLPTEQQPRVRRERRRGKWCTIVAGLAVQDLKPLLKVLRSELGVGGGVSDDELVLQGDHRDAVVGRLVQLGYQARAAGG